MTHLKESRGAAAHCTLRLLNFLVHCLVLPRDFMFSLWQHHHRSFEGIWTKKPVVYHSAPSKSSASTTRETSSIADSHFPWMPWVFPGTLHPAAEFPQDGHASSSAFFFPWEVQCRGSKHSSQHILVFTVTTRGWSSGVPWPRVWWWHWPPRVVTCTGQPGGPLGEGGVFLCRDCHLVVTGETLSPLKATLSPQLCWEGAGRNEWLHVPLEVSWVCFWAACCMRSDFTVAVYCRWVVPASGSR